MRDVSDVVEELVAAVQAARRIDELLVRVRQERPELSLVDIEQLIDRYYDRGTISRKTAAALGKSRH
jgi:hypothetical protein